MKNKWRQGRTLVRILSYGMVLAGVLTACDPALDSSAQPPRVTPSVQPLPAHTPLVLPAPLQLRTFRDFGLISYADALHHAQELPVKGRAPKTGYRRRLYGAPWMDAVDVEFGRNGCRTREDILARDLIAVRYREGNPCIVESGILWDPYTGTVVPFQRGPHTSADVQIDHVVALADSWVKGAQQWSLAKRQAFANDPRNLLAVKGSANQQKGAGDTATWLPSYKPYRCEYVTRQVEIKRIYGLWVTRAERDAMTRILSRCAVRPQKDSNPRPIG